MNKIGAVIFIIFLFSANAFAQPTTAKDFTMSDCATGKVHNLFSILDSGNVVIMEFFMLNCYPCVDAGKALDSMYRKLRLDCSNIRFFQTSFNNSDKCSSVFNWVDTNGFSSVPFDSGAAQISYYGFFGMPTVAVAAGSTHKLLYLLISGGFNDSDTAIIADSIRTYCAISGMNDKEKEFAISVFPNPASREVKVESKSSRILDVQVLDLRSRVVTDPLPYREIIRLDGLADGMYLLTIRTEKGLAFRKLVVQNSP